MGALRCDEPGRDGHRVRAGRARGRSGSCSASSGAVAGRMRHARPSAPRHADRRTDAAPAGGSDDLRAEGRRVARRRARRRCPPSRAGDRLPAELGGAAGTSRRSATGASRFRRSSPGSSGSPSRRCRGMRTGSASPSSVPRSRSLPACSPRSRSTCSSSHRPRSARSGRAARQAVRPRCRRSTTRSARCGREPAPRSCAAMRRCSSGSLAGEHERGAGSWQAGWEALSGALRTTGGAAAALAGALEGLEVDEARMRAEPRSHGRARGRERVALVLAERVGRTAAASGRAGRVASSGGERTHARRGARVGRHGAHARRDRAR